MGTAPCATQPTWNNHWSIPARNQLGYVVGARSGDKGGDANLGDWARTDDAHEWLAGWLTVAAAVTAT